MALLQHKYSEKMQLQSSYMNKKISDYNLSEDEITQAVGPRFLIEIVNAPSNILKPFNML